MNNQDSNPLQERNEGIDFFKYLVNISLADGIIDEAERNILHRSGKKFGLTDPEIDQLIAKPVESNYHPPYELEKRFHQLYKIVLLITADEQIHDDEMKFAMYFAIASGFDPAQADKLIHFILQGIEDGLDEEDLFIKYKKKY
jgi:hypothetical protein